MMDCVAGEHQKGGGVAEKGGTPEMEVVGIDICSVCTSLKNKRGCKKRTQFTNNEKHIRRSLNNLFVNVFMCIEIGCRDKEITA